MDPDARPTGTGLLADVLERLGDGPESLVAFARAYLQRIPFDAGLSPPLAQREVEELFAFIEERREPVAVRVFNPMPAGAGGDGTVVDVHVDDAPFLVDSVTAELQAHGLEVIRVLHPVMGAVRDASGRLEAVVPAGQADNLESVERYILDRRLDPVDHPALADRVRGVLRDVLAAVADFAAMVDTTSSMARVVRAGRDHYPPREAEEAEAFLEWLTRDNFVFLGYREYRIVGSAEGPALAVDPGTGLGILSDPSASRVSQPVALAALPDEVVVRYEQGGLLVVSKTNRLSTVHRRARMDYVGVRRLSPEGETIGEMRLLGLFTSKAYMESVGNIPILREKLAAISSSEDLIEGSHDHKAVVALVESFPKDELFGLPTEDLRKVVMGLLALQERARVRLFVRRKLLDRGVRIMVAMPRERFSSELRRKLQDLFVERFGGIAADFHLSLDRTDLARLHFTVWVPEGHTPEVAFEDLDAEVMALTRSWEERVAELLAGRHGAAQAREMTEKWARCLPEYYAASTEIGVAVGDVEHLQELEESGHRSLVALQNEKEGPELLTRVALYERQGKRALSELTPALEDMGLTVVEEVPTRLAGDEEIFIHDFGVLDSSGALLDLGSCGDRVARALEGVWSGEAESDSLHRLLLGAELDHHQVGILRAYQTYWRRISPIFTINYVHDALVANPSLTAGLVRLFELRFDPASDGAGYEEEREELLLALDAIPSLDEDRILRGFLRLIDATVRTNAYRANRSALSLKLRSAQVPDMPSPVPLYEVFVLAGEMEGIHLRAGLQARGGIRWSERREDYRTEVLGLMKAQITKNALIVPTGAKGGFVLRSPPSDPAEVKEAVQAAYETYIRALIDVTDNLVDGVATHPPHTRIHDGPDAYLVVAADRGTARFSDLANRIAREHGFWLDDAFASGGSSGYDHKQMGITARGAWKSLERHFREIELNPYEDTFTVVGVGDMSGDVFGNGMLESDRIALIAAFDHRHIFLDPDPDPAGSFRERRRLFETPGSNWDDYDRDALSPGGGVFSRTAKKVELSPQAREALGTEAAVVTPAELVRIILSAPVYLFWNGGIGTYVKAAGETHADVGDRTNDSVRVDAGRLRARVVVEGGNLGLTQRGRIEYARAGGRINADFVDNSGGVNCSDREVNLKILLSLAERGREIDRDERDRILQEAAEPVVSSILSDSLAQAHRLALEELASRERLEDYEQLMGSLAGRGIVDRSVEFLPTSQEMSERVKGGGALTRPELAVLSAHAKRSLAEDLHESHLPDSDLLFSELSSYFPPAVADRFRHLLPQHPLRRELISARVANRIVDSQGPTFVSRLVHRRGANVAEVVTAFLAARSVMGADSRGRIEGAFHSLPLDLWQEMMATDERLVATLTRWYLTNAPGGMAESELARAAAAFGELEREGAEWGPLQRRAERKARLERLKTAGVSPEVARRVVLADDLIHAPDILAVVDESGRSLADVGHAFHVMGKATGLDRLQRTLSELQLADRWQQWALQTIEDDLLAVRRALVERVLISTGAEAIDEAVEEFLARRAGAVGRATELVRFLAAEPVADVAPFMVVVRQLQSLAAAP